jgi:hypothetical protein
VIKETSHGKAYTVGKASKTCQAESDKFAEDLRELVNARVEGAAAAIRAGMPIEVTLFAEIKQALLLGMEIQTTRKVSTLPTRAME